MPPTPTSGSRRPRKAQRAAVMDCVVAYMRVSTDEQADSGAGLAAQRGSIEAEVSRRGWAVMAWCEDVCSGATPPERRAGLMEALALLRNCEAGVLVVSKLDRLSRSVLDFATLLAAAQREGWQVVCLDLGVDMTTPAGEMVAGNLATFAQYERRIIGQRTRDALAARRAAGVRLGRRSSLPADVRARIVRDRKAGIPWRTIVDNLNAEGVPTGQGGGRWHLSSLQKAHASAVADNVTG